MRLIWVGPGEARECSREDVGPRALCPPEPEVSGADVPTDGQGRLHFFDSLGVIWRASVSFSSKRKKTLHPFPF